MKFNFIKYIITSCIVVTTFFSPTKLSAQCTLQVFTNLVNDECQGGSNGSASSVGIFGTQPYTAVWTNSSGVQVNMDTGLNQGQASTPSNLTTGTYIVTFTDATGTCVISNTISIGNITIDTTTSFNNGTITSNQASGTTYRWLDCNDGMSVIPGETSMSFTPISSGNYAVELTKFGCVAISECALVNTLGISEYLYPKRLSISPNPVNDILKISIDEKLEKIEVYNILGQKVIESTYKSIDVSNLQNGMYLINVKTSRGALITKRFIKK